MSPQSAAAASCNRPPAVWSSASIFRTHGSAAAAAAARTKVNAWIHIGSDDSVTLYDPQSRNGAGHRDFAFHTPGRGTRCGWSKIRTEFPGIDPAFGNQGVLGSASIRSRRDLCARPAPPRAKCSSKPPRKNGVSINLAVPRPNGVVVNTATGAHADLRRARRSRREIAAAHRYRLERSGPVPRHRQVSQSASILRTKSTANQIRHRRPRARMLHAVVARCPVFGGKVRGIRRRQSQSHARREARPADFTAWPSSPRTPGMPFRREGRSNQWDEGPNAASTARHPQELDRAALQPGAVGRKTATPPPRSPPPPKRSKPFTKRPSSPTLPWSRSTAWPTCAPIAAKSGHPRNARAPPIQEALRITGFVPTRCRSTPNTWAADSAAAPAPITSPNRSKFRKPYAFP